MVRGYGLLILLVFGVVLSGCKGLPGGMQTPEQVVMNRSSLYWELVREAEFKRMYDELLCSETKKELPFREFVTIAAKIPYKETQVVDATVDPDGKHAVVTVSFNVDFNQYELKGMKMKEDWVWEQGNWYLKLELDRNPFKE